MKTLVTLLVLSSAMFCYAQDHPHARILRQPQGPGRITGTVLNEEGQPVANANICIAAEGPSMVSYCNGVTDSVGHFEIEHVAMCSFLISDKEEDGYSPSHDPKNRVALTLQEPTANLNIKLGPKAAMLIGSVTDSVTGKPVDNVRVKYIPVTEERAGSGTSSEFMRGEFKLNLPTTSDFVIIVAAKGYNR